MKKTTKKTTKNTRAPRKLSKRLERQIGQLNQELDEIQGLKSTTSPPRTAAEKAAIEANAAELEALSRQVRAAASGQSAAELEVKATRRENQKLEARLFLLGAANMYLAERLVKAAAMIERATSRAETYGLGERGRRLVPADAFDDVIAFCKGMI